ncbi:MAG TPA: ABC transporter permease [Vicinamibacterales bacterium]|nr:ABC transporter permease [Acidobacteriota bacterium]HOC18379.1 ABC transporter permease [Vicinamibacterales bacterium]
MPSPTAAVPRPRERLVIQPPGRVGSGLAGHLRSLPRYAELLYVLTAHRVRVRYKQSALGLLWAVLQPLLLMLIFTMIYALIASRMSSGGLPYSLFVYAAILPWTFFSTSVGNATGSLVGHSNLVTKVWFPRELLPISYVTAAVFDLAVASILLFGLMAWHGVALAPLAWLALPIVALIALLALAIGLLAAAIQVRFRDIGLAIPLLLQVWMFLSPVIYPFEQVPDRFKGLYSLNPMAGLIDGFRRVTVQGQAPDWALLSTSAVIVALLLPSSYMFFKWVDATLADRM